LQWFPLAFDDFKIPSIILFHVIDLIFGGKTSSQTDKRVKLVKPAKQKERRGGHRAFTGPLAWCGPSAIGGPPAMEWALAFGGPPAFDGLPIFDEPSAFGGPSAFRRTPALGGPLPLRFTCS